MKKKNTSSSKTILAVYRTVVAVVITLVLVLAAGTLFAVFRPPASAPLIRIGGNAPAGGGFNFAETAITTGVFTGIGRLRIPVAGAAGISSATVILSVSFPYPANDRPFAEELNSRIGEFRSIAIEYFSSLPANQITRLDEDAAREELLHRFNSLLRLGRIETLFFTDLIVID